jgi:hypothetical protein
MTSIAANPDYQRLSYSRDFANGAPVVSGGNIPANQLGRTDTAVASDGRRIPVQYAVVEADSVLPSHNADGTPNADYGQGYAGTMAIAGNGRIAGLQRAWQQGTAGNYAQELINDAQMTGIDPAVIAGMQNPVLTRVMPREEVTNDIGDVSNTSSNLSLNTVEQAQNDANRIDLDALSFNEDGSISPRTARQFVAAMPQSEQGGMLDAKGQPTRQAIDRLNAAIFVKGYADGGLVELYAQATDMEAATVLKGMAEAASMMARLDGMGAFDVRSIVSEAAGVVVTARRNGMRLDEAARQMDISADPLVGDVVGFFARNIRSAKRIAEGLKRLAQTAYNEATRPDMDMFGQAPAKMSREQLIDLLNEEENGQGNESGLEQQSRQEPVPQDAGRGGTERQGQRNGLDIEADGAAEVGSQPVEAAENAEAAKVGGAETSRVTLTGKESGIGVSADADIVEGEGSRRKSRGKDEREARVFTEYRDNPEDDELGPRIGRSGYAIIQHMYAPIRKNMYRGFFSEQEHKRLIEIRREADEGKRDASKNFTPLIEEADEILKEAQRRADADLEQRRISGARVRDFVEAVLSGSAHPRSIVIQVATANKRDKVLEETGVDIGQAREILVDDRVVHAQGGHPSLTLDDWAMLPEIAETFTESYPGAGEKNQGTTRLIFVKRGEPKDYAYIAEFAKGKGKGERLQVITFFKASKKGIDDFLERNRKKRDEAHTAASISSGNTSKAHDAATPSASSIAQQWQAMSREARARVAVAAGYGEGHARILASNGDFGKFAPDMRERMRQAMEESPALELTGETPAQARENAKKREEANDSLTKEQIDREREAFSLSGQSQPKPQGMAQDLFTADGRATVAAQGSKETGHAQPLSSLVLTPLGWRKMGDLAVGDVVMAANGEETTVEGIYPQGRKPVFRILLEDGGEAMATEDHLWHVREEGEEEWKTVSTSVLLAGVRDGKRYELPEVTA